MYTKKKPIVSISTCRVFFGTLTRFQTWHKDKISLFSFNIFYFVSRLIKTWNRYRRKYCERVSFISDGPSLFSTVHEILNGWWKSFCRREPTNMDSKALRALYRMSVSKGVSELRVVCFQIKHTLFTDLNKISKTSINKPHKRLWEKGKHYSTQYCTVHCSIYQLRTLHSVELWHSLPKFSAIDLKSLR